MKIFGYLILGSIIGFYIDETGRIWFKYLEKCQELNKLKKERKEEKGQQ